MKVDVPRLLEALGVENITPQGKSILASCPLGTHSDSDPSFDILNDPDSDKHGYWRCYGCHEGGGPVALVRRLKCFEGMGGGVLARNWLARLELHAMAAGPVVGQVTITHAIIPFGPRFFHPRDSWITAPLTAWPGPLRKYALSRGITREQVDRWKIGYSVAGRLAGRIIFPIYDETGRLSSYSARTAVGSRVRYLTPHSSENPDPASIFGRAGWPPRHARSVCVVVEGAINQLAVERATGLPGGALGGSNDAAAQWIHFATFKRLILLSDSDKAGDRVAEAFELAGEGPEVRRARLPAGMDAQSAPEALVREKIERVA